ncbi:hypothetical protein HJC23_002628 [Cyclotella cryptica]|uniref:Hexose transporter 1 n=1 Tax=Cyclotella cryptica TaxID=29204 RepID=A0ABD3PYL1_9STRA|eukprot:CCRYP_010382-RA/>CCRYP_010382-RA protein AED:0.04 eAED:0.04 QI:105/1/1/1/1/1/4/641/647
MASTPNAISSSSSVAAPPSNLSTPLLQTTMEPNPNTIADGYSRTDQHFPIATSTTPVAPPLDFDYNDGVANAFDSEETYGATAPTHVNNDGDDDDDADDSQASETGMDRHLPHHDNPLLAQTHEGEHRYDHGTPLKITRATKLYAFCAALNSCNLGYDIGVNTGAGMLVQESLGLTDLQLEIFMGSLNLFAMVGALCSSWFSDRLGRRWAFRIAAVGFIFGTVVQSSAGGFAGLMVGRTFVGLGVGFGLAVDPVYIGEISQAAHRGQLVTWSEIATNVGICLGFLAGLVFSSLTANIAWRLMFCIGAILPIIVIYLATFVMPESPRWLVSKNREDEALQVLKMVYPDGYDVNVIVSEIREGMEKEAIAEHAVGWDVILFPTPAFKRMLMVGVGTAVAQQAVGIDAIQYFLVYILDESGIKSRNAQMGILLFLGFIKLAVIVMAGYLFDRRGRRPLFFVSLLGMSVALVLISMAFVGGASSEGFAVFGLALYLAFFSVGMGPGCWLIPSEVFSTMIRAKAMSVATFMNRVTATLMASTFLSVANAMSWAGFFIMLSIICLIILVWMFVYLPETKGRALEDMSQYFAEITGDRSILEAEESLYRTDEPPARAAAPAPAPAPQPEQPRPQRPVVPRKPPPEDAHVVGTMA